jgi:hypothetical protein
MSSKICSKCKIEKDLSAFSKALNKPLGVRSSCRACDSKSLKDNKLAKENVERLVCFPKMPDCLKRCSTCKICKEKSEFKKNKAQRDGFCNYCKTCANDSQNKYLFENPGKRKQHKQARRAFELGAEGTFSDQEWYDLLEKYKGICPGCGKMKDKFAADHIVPLSRGGTNWISNIQPLCKSCNSSKHAKTIRFPIPGEEV